MTKTNPNARPVAGQPGQPQPDPSPPSRPAPLAGVRILDLSRVLAGPWATMILGDLGAEVIKVENPKGGDDTRHWGPPYLGGEAAYYLCANRNKKSVAIDLACPAGQEAVRGLAAQSDILVENFKLGGLARFGLDYSDLAPLFPRLIYCSISGFGRSGPNAALPGYDFVAQAMAGLMSVNGEADGPPLKVGIPVADLFTGMAAAQAMLAALIARDRDGRGQHIDMALYDVQLAMMANVASSALMSGKEGRRWGNQHPSIVPYQTFATADGHIVIAVGNDRQFRFLVQVLGLASLADDPDFATNPERSRNRERLIPLLAAKLIARSTAEWVQICAEAGVPAGPVRGVLEAIQSTDSAARSMVHHLPHPSAGTVSVVGSPLRFGATPVVTPSAPPMLGAQSAEVLGALLGYDEAQIQAVRGAP